MISKKKAAGVLLLIVLCVLAAPGAARTIANGGVAFDCETDLNISAVAEDGDELVYFLYDDPEMAELLSIPVDDASALNLSAFRDSLKMPHGAYYVRHDGVIQETNKINILNPEVSLNVCLDTGTLISVSERTVKNTTPIAFCFGALQVGTFLPTATVRVEITTPDGGIVTGIPDANGTVRDLTNITLSAPSVYLRNIDINRLESGAYTARAVWESPQDFADYAADSSCVNFTVTDSTISIATSKESLIRNNPFLLTVNGNPKAEYYLYVRDAAVAPDRYPYIRAGQPSVTIADDAFAGAADPDADALANSERAAADGAYAPGTAAVVATDSNGICSVFFCTTTNTTPLTYVVTALDPADASKRGDVRVRVNAGEVTITAEGAGIYYLGDTVKLSGTNTDNKYTYLFITGKNLGDGAGVALDNLSACASAGNYVRCPVTNKNVEYNIWAYNWDTTAPARSGQILAPATYTVYACGNNVDSQGNNIDKYHLSGVQYQTFSILLRVPTVNMQSSGAVAARGDPFTIAGYVNGKPERVKLWVFGENYRVFGANVTVESSGDFAYTLDGEETENLSAGRYDVVVQHPAVDGTFNVYPFMPENATDFRIANTWSSDVADLGPLTSSDAAAALVEMIEAPESDDVCCRDSFSVDDAWIAIDPIENRTVGRWVEITGTTNVAAGSTLNVEVFSNASVSCTSGQVQVIRDTGCNRLAFTVDSSGFEPGPYVVTVESAAFGIRKNGSFNLVEKKIVSEGVLSLSPGWNFVSTPKALAAGNDTAAIFAGVDSAGHSALRYDAPARTWVILKADDQISPLEGYWIYAAEKTDVHLTYANASPQATPGRALITGWNAIGFSDTEPVAAREALFSLGDAWWKLTGFNATTRAYELPIIQGSSGSYSDARLMMPMKGYWLYMTENGTLAAVGV